MCLLSCVVTDHRASAKTRGSTDSAQCVSEATRSRGGTRSDAVGGNRLDLHGR